MGCVERKSSTSCGSDLLTCLKRSMHSLRDLPGTSPAMAVHRSAAGMLEGYLAKASSKACTPCKERVKIKLFSASVVKSLLKPKFCHGHPYSLLLLGPNILTACTGSWRLRVGFLPIQVGYARRRLALCLLSPDNFLRKKFYAKYDWSAPLFRNVAETLTVEHSGYIPGLF